MPNRYIYHIIDHIIDKNCVMFINEGGNLDTLPPSSHHVSTCFRGSQWWITKTIYWYSPSPIPYFTLPICCIAWVPHIIDPNGSTRFADINSTTWRYNSNCFTYITVGRRLMVGQIYAPIAISSSLTHVP